MLQSIFEFLKSTPSDINEHLDTLKEYGEKCEHITEMGVRSIISTFAFLIAKPKTLICYDITHPSKFSNNNFLLLNKSLEEFNGKFEFIQANTLNVIIEETDLLFIDTQHTYRQLIQELNLHKNSVKKYIILHDTTSYEFKDEVSYGDWDKGVEVNKQGLWIAVEEFLEKNNMWELEKRFTHNNGLTILKRIKK